MSRIYKFNDYPFNAMNFFSPSMIEAHFNVGNPKKKDIIVKRDKQYKIVDLDYFNGIYTLYVKEISKHNTFIDKVKQWISIK